MTFTPGAGGAQPSDLYDVTLLCDTHGVDVLAGEGANLSNATSRHGIPFLGNAAGTSYVRQWLHGGGYTLSVAGAGATKSGTVVVHKLRHVL